MKTRMILIIGLLIIELSLIAAADCAEEKKAEPSKAEPAKAEPAKAEPAKAEPTKATPSKEFGDFGWISRGKQYGPWWILNSRWYDPLPEPFLYHLDTYFSFSNSSGNVDGEYWDVRAELVLRKKFINSDTSYVFQRSDTTTAFGSTLVERENLLQMLSFDIYKWLAIEGGYVFYNSTANFYDDSHSIFGGIGTWPLSRKNLWAKLGVYYGYGKTSYRNDALALFGIHMPDYESDGVFLQQKLFWNITDKINFTESLFCVYTFQDSDPPTIYGFQTDLDSNVVQLIFNATLSYHITTIFSVFTRYELRYNDNALGSAQAELFEYHKDDTSIAFGLKISL